MLVKRALNAFFESALLYVYSLLQLLGIYPRETLHMYVSEAKESEVVSSSENEWIGSNGPLLPRRHRDRLNDGDQTCKGGRNTLGELSSYCVDSSGKMFFLKLTCWLHALGLTVIGHVSHSRQVNGSGLVGFGS